MKIRSYQPSDYSQIFALYNQGDLYGGQFDEDRDSSERLNKLIEESPDAILVAEEDGIILGTVSLVKDSRLAFLFRFAAQKGPQEFQALEALYAHAEKLLKSEGHKQVLVYSPVSNKNLDARYTRLGFAKGGNYAAYWKVFGS